MRFEICFLNLHDPLCVNVQDADSPTGQHVLYSLLAGAVHVAYRKEHSHECVVFYVHLSELIGKQVSLFLVGWCEREIYIYIF